MNILTPPSTLGELGRGGTGIVYRAEQQSLRREVALKVLNRELTQDQKFVERFVAEAREADLRMALNIPPEAILLVYGGNVGAAAGVETVIEAFQDLGDGDNVYLLIAGEGARLAECQRLAEARGSPRIWFYSPWPQSETSTVLSAADILLLPTRGTQSLASVPSKLITYMMTGRPVVALAVPESELAGLLTRTGCGWLVEPDRPELLANILREVVACDKSILEQRGQAGRKYALAHLSRTACLPRVIEILEMAAT